jgi:hypothetical protein
MKKEALWASKKPEAMDYLRSHNVELSQKIEHLVQPESEKVKTLERTHALEQELER